jgi:hypothetical protein
LHVTHAAAPVWTEKYTEFTFPGSDETDEVLDVKLTADLWVPVADFYGSPIRNGDTIFVNRPYNGPKDKTYAVFFTNGNKLLQIISVSETFFYENGIYKIKLHEKFTNPGVSDFRIYLAVQERVSVSPARKPNGAFRVDWPSAPFPPLPSNARVTYRTPRTDVSCVRITPENRLEYSSPILDRLPDFKHLLFVNANGDTSGALRHVGLYDYYFVASDDESREIVDELAASSEFRQTFETAPADAIGVAASFVV